jgi:preprotein translocase subunit SecE
MSTVENVKGPVLRGSGDGGGGITGWWESSRSFLTEVRNEMKRVTWPSRKEVYATTVVVILTSAFFGIYLWSLDLGLSWVVNWIFKRFGAA